MKFGAEKVGKTGQKQHFWQNPSVPKFGPTNLTNFFAGLDRGVLAKKLYAKIMDFSILKSQKSAKYHVFRDPHFAEASLDFNSIKKMFGDSFY